MAHESARSVLIAGAGDVGMRLARLQVARGNEVIALRRRACPAETGIGNLSADLNSGAGFERLPKRPDALVFCAAPDERSESAYRRLYVDGLRRLLDRVEATRVLFVSSTAVYGQDAGELVDEQTLAEPTAFNGRVLLAAEHELSAHAQGLVLRLSGLYGPGRESMLRRARALEPGRPHWCNRIHVDDAATALSQLLALPQPQRLYLGSDDLPVLETQLLAWLRAQENLPAIATSAGPISGRRVNNRRLRDCGWLPAYPDYRSGYRQLLANAGV